MGQLLPGSESLGVELRILIVEGGGLAYVSSSLDSLSKSLLNYILRELRFHFVYVLTVYSLFYFAPIGKVLH